ncbi:hypothetical protein C1646_774522 [Rhizophagus diaphanus]|nr:hypothetical protein C1646_774522 [Rhizophagus diaphanus] [Rhizophagus sp. MUCL 43196]
MEKHIITLDDWTSLSDESYIAEFLAQQIQLILEEIGIQKFADIITDAGSNVRSAQNLISGRFSHLLNIRYIVINENSNIIMSEAVKIIINQKREFFNNVYDLSNVIKPIRNAILSFESSKSTLADCYFFLTCLSQSINKVSENENVNFHQHAIKSFNKHFKMYDFDEYLLSYYIHLNYRGFSIKGNQYQRIQSVAAFVRGFGQFMNGCKSELPNYSKDQTANEFYAILNDAHLCDDDKYVDDYNKEKMIKLISNPPIDHDLVLDLDSMFRDNSTDKQLELDGLDNFIQELDEKDNFDLDSLVQSFIS